MTLSLPSWEARAAIVLASGQSALDILPWLLDLPVSAYSILAVNLSYRLAPGAEVMYAADSGFWQHYVEAHKFAGAKVSADEVSRTYCRSVQLARILKTDAGAYVDRMQRGPLGVLGCGGGNSAYQALNLAVQMGANPIYLAGVDYVGGHWHPDHPAKLRNPTVRQLQRWREQMDAAAPLLQSWGVQVYNLSRISTLRAFPHVEPDRISVNQGPAALSA